VVKFVSTLALIIGWYTLLEQPADFKNRLDTNGVIRIAKRHNAYWTKLWFAPPGIYFDTEKCAWVVTSIKHKQTNRGRCKHIFNGCTKVITVTLTIDAKSKKVVSRMKEKEVYGNHE
jgi:hypothetical protein